MEIIENTWEIVTKIMPRRVWVGYSVIHCVSLCVIRKLVLPCACYYCFIFLKYQLFLAFLKNFLWQKIKIYISRIL